MPTAAAAAGAAEVGRARPAEARHQAPEDAIRAGKAGTKPLSEHIRKHEQKRIAAEAAKGPPREVRARGCRRCPETPASGGRERPRRGGVRAIIPLREEEGAATTFGGREQRQLKRKKAATVQPAQGRRRRRRHRLRLRKRTPHPADGHQYRGAAARERVVELPCTVRSFSEAIGVPARTILAKLLELGTMSNIAATLDTEMAELLAVELGVQVNFNHPLDLEQQVMQPLEEEKTTRRSCNRVRRSSPSSATWTTARRRFWIASSASTWPPTKKAASPNTSAPIGSTKDGRAIAFVDTPGHEAFTEMRARGANVTDIAVLVVAADDGVMPQTEEAISHARAAEVPIVVAPEQDRPAGGQSAAGYEQLAANELLPSEWGGETEVIKTSATTGEGVDALLETLLTVAELRQYKANPEGPGRGTN